MLTVACFRDLRRMFQQRSPMLRCGLLASVVLLAFVTLLMHSCNAQEDHAALAVVPECKATGSGTTSVCLPSCMVCKNTGTVLRQKECLCCRPGWVKNPAMPAQCTACPIGTYAPQPGMTPCRDCARGLTTLRKGSKLCDGEQRSTCLCRPVASALI